MAYTTFYCNENMLLEHWQDYHESNLMLRNLLKRTTLSPIECATIYYERMRNPESVSYDRSHLIQMFSRGRKNNAPILDVHQVVLYQKDLDYITEARRRYHINWVQLRVLFGIIFFCRLYGTSMVALDTEFKMKRFGGCFEEQTEITYCSGPNWDDGYNAVRGMRELSDVYLLLNRTSTDDIGCLYTYPNYSLDKNDVIAYTFNVTLENNRLNLSPVVRELFNSKECYCTVCGTQYISQKPNASLYCKDCAIKKEKARLAKIRKK
jgi:hypothetical protein